MAEQCLGSPSLGAAATPPCLTPQGALGPASSPSECSQSFVVHAHIPSMCRLMGEALHPLCCYCCEGSDRRWILVMHAGGSPTEAADLIPKGQHPKSAMPPFPVQDSGVYMQKSDETLPQASRQGSGCLGHRYSSCGNLGITHSPKTVPWELLLPIRRSSLP